MVTRIREVQPVAAVQRRLQGDFRKEKSPADLRNAQIDRLRHQHPGFGKGSIIRLESRLGQVEMFVRATGMIRVWFDGETTFRDIDPTGVEVVSVANSIDAEE